MEDILQELDTIIHSGDASDVSDFDALLDIVRIAFDNEESLSSKHLGNLLRQAIRYIAKSENVAALERDIMNIIKSDAAHKKPSVQINGISCIMQFDDPQDYMAYVAHVMQEFAKDGKVFNACLKYFGTFVPDGGATVFQNIQDRPALRLMEGLREFDSQRQHGNIVATLMDYKPQYLNLNRMGVGIIKKSAVIDDDMHKAVIQAMQQFPDSMSIQQNGMHCITKRDSLSFHDYDVASTASQIIEAKYQSQSEELHQILSICREKICMDFNELDQAR